VSSVRYELGFYIPKDDILHIHCRRNLKSDMYSRTLYCVSLVRNDVLEKDIASTFRVRRFLNRSSS
jgi:hypothetical protein